MANQTLSLMIQICENKTSTQARGSNGHTVWSHGVHTYTSMNETFVHQQGLTNMVTFSANLILAVNNSWAFNWWCIHSSSITSSMKTNHEFLTLQEIDMEETRYIEHWLIRMCQCMNINLINIYKHEVMYSCCFGRKSLFSLTPSFFETHFKRFDFKNEVYWLLRQRPQFICGKWECLGCSVVFIGERYFKHSFVISLHINIRKTSSNWFKFRFWQK